MVANEIVDAAVLEEIKKKGYKKCSWCGRVIDRYEGCNIISCHCKNEFCYRCGEVEIVSHRCIHGCPLFEYDDPKYKIKSQLKRDPTQEEHEFFDKLIADYQKKTEIDREIVKKHYKNNHKDEVMKIPSKRILIENGALVNAQTVKVNSILAQNGRYLPQ